MDLAKSVGLLFVSCFFYVITFLIARGILFFIRHHLFNFSKGIEITDKDGNEQIIYAFEPSWILSMKYPMHPPKLLRPGSYIAKVDVKTTTIPLLDIPEGISKTVEDRGALQITKLPAEVKRPEQ